MSRGYFEFRPYVSVAQRRAIGQRELQKLSKKSGGAVSPVVLAGRKIAGTFWGKAWCDNLEAYSDFANRLPRGRSYVRNGSVVDLQISAGEVSARVAGSDLYRIKIKIKPLSAERWKSIQAECAGKIDSLLELLQGRLSSSVMEIVTKPERGLFPAPKDISLDCSCPDWADLCKHVAASLYGVGARLDTNPELLFLLRGVDPSDLIGKVSAAEAVRQTTPSDAPTMSESEMADVFGIELASPSEPPAGNSSRQVQVAAKVLSSVGGALQKPTPRPSRAARKQPRVSALNPSPVAPAASTVAKPKTVHSAKAKQKLKRKISAATRARLEAIAARRWAKVKASARPASGAKKAPTSSSPPESPALDVTQVVPAAAQAGTAQAGSVAPPHAAAARLDS
jgi:uncharacterized Zn finger protein